jgi:hypothetical protein
MNIGQKCNVNNNIMGACLSGGTITCDPANPAVPKCVPDAPGIGEPYVDQGGDPSATTPAPNGSFDWNCSGVVETSYPSPDFKVFDSCGSNGTGWCAYWFNGTSQAACENGGAPYLLAPVATCGRGSCTPDTCDYGPSAVCGQYLTVVYCQWSGGTCSERIAPHPTPYTEGCE